MQDSFFKYFPLLGYVILWGSVIYLHYLSLFNLKVISGDTYVILISAILSLTLGYLIFGLFDVTTFNKNRSIPKFSLNEPLFIKLIISLSFFSFLGGAIKMLEVGNALGGVEIYLERPLMVRQYIVGIQLGDNEVTFLYKIGGYLSNVGFLSCILGGIFFAKKGKIRLIGLIPFLAILIDQLSMIGRYKFITSIVFFLVSFVLFSFFLKREERAKRLFEISVYSTGSLFFVIVLSYYIIKLRSPLADDIIELMKELIYLYFSGGLTALDNFLQSDFHFTYGESSFRTIFKWLARIGIIPQESVIRTHNEFVKVTTTHSTNTYTFVKSLYQDFGLFGLLLISFGWGALSKIAITRVYTNLNLVNITIAAIFTFSLLISFFSFYFQSITGIFYWIIIASIIQYFYKGRLFIKSH